MYIPEDEMGDDEDWVTRWTWHNYAKPYPVVYPFQNTNRAYVLVNNDEHDRLLTDPAYRLAKAESAHYALDAQYKSILELEENYLWTMGGKFPKSGYTMEDYKDLVTSEMAIRNLDHIFYKVSKFNRRAQLDINNHSRRQARMEERAAARN